MGEWDEDESVDQACPLAELVFSVFPQIDERQRWAGMPRLILAG